MEQPPHDEAEIRALIACLGHRMEDTIQAGGAFYRAEMGEKPKDLSELISKLRSVNQEDLQLRMMATMQSQADDRAAAEEALVSMGAAAVPYLLEALSSRDGVQEIHIISVLGKIKDARAVEPLLAMLEDQDERPSFIASALGQIGDERAVLPLIRLLEQAETRGKQVQESQRKRIGEHSIWWRRKLDGMVSALLLRALAPDKSPRSSSKMDADWARVSICISAMLALMELKDRRAIPAIERRRKDKEKHVRVVAEAALSKLSG